MESTYFVFREAESLDELKSLLLLRFSVYMGSRFHNFPDKYGRAGIELDCYDLRSRHLGLFKHEHGSSRPVGYLRMVIGEEGAQAGWVRSIAAEVPEVAEAVRVEPTAPLPLMTYFLDGDVVQGHYEMAKASGRHPVEVGRLSLEKAVRSISVARNVVTSLITIGIIGGVKDAFITIVPGHARFYEAFGFGVCAGTAQHFCAETKTDLVCLHWEIERFQGATRDAVLSMSEAYFQTGRICFDPSAPGNYYAPTGSFISSRPRLSAAA